MKLYVLRHADAENHAPSDAARALTPPGLEQARTVGAFCQRCRLQPDLILTSPYRRAVQTAEAVAAALGKPLQTVPFLASGMRREAAFDELRAFQRFEAVMIVGHQPDFGDLISALLGLPNSENFPVGKASLTCLELARLAPGAGSLQFSLPVKMMN